METKQKIIEVVERCKDTEKLKIVYQFALGLLNNAAAPTDAAQQRKNEQ